jgi:hypothetical protein
MTHNPEVPAPLAHKERVEYASMKIDDEFAIYERENHQAWIQSNKTMAVRQ